VGAVNSAIGVGGGQLLAGFLGMMCGVQMMTMRQMGMMRRLLMSGAAVVLGRLAMLVGGGLVVLGGLVVVVCQQACVHDPLLLRGGRHARFRIGHEVGDAHPIVTMTIA